MAGRDPALSHDASDAKGSLRAPRLPPWRSEADDEERAFHDDERWEGLCALLFARLDATTTPALRARYLLRLAGVLEDGLGDLGQAFDGLVEAYLCAPDDGDVLDHLERLAAKLGRHAELVAASVERLSDPACPSRIPLFANAVRWLATLERLEEADAFRAALAELDPSHPVVLLHAASAARHRGAGAEHVGLLLRALERTPRDRERAHIHVALGEAQAVPIEAFRHFQTAIALCPDDDDVLFRFERAAADSGQLQDARWALEAQVRRATGERKLEATLRLAELLGTGFLQHEEAAELLRAAVVEAPDSLPARRLLERTYLALRDLPRLLGAIGDRAARAGSPSARGEAFAFASEIAETEGLDLKLARDFMERAVAACPEAPSFLARAASLAERAEARDVAIGYRKRLVAVLDDPHERARQHVAMAGLCDDPRERRLHFERAASEVPGHAAAWEGLEKVASELGERVANPSALRAAIEATLAPRRKAQLLLLLGAQLAKTDREAAFRACDEAFRTDPSNERAAAVMVDRLSDEKRHSEALVASELLLAAATRDEKPAEAAVLVRKLAGLALAVGDPGKALAVCLAAMGTLPKDAHPLGELAFALAQCSAAPELAPRITRAVDLLVARLRELEPSAVCALGSFLAARGDHERAILVLLPALDSDASHRRHPWSTRLTREALEVLSPAYEATGDLRSAVATRLALSRLSADARRHVLLVSAIDLLVRRLGDLGGAVPVLDEALAHRPHDLPLLHTAMRVFGELHAWTRLAPIVGRIAALQDVPERRAKYLAAQAQIVSEKLQDRARAADLYDAVLDADKTRLDAFSTLTRLYDALGDHQALERAYRKMIARVRDDGEPELTVELFKKLSRVYANRLGDVASAERALEAARRLAPTDRSVRALAVDVLVGGDELERAVAVLRSDIRRDPHDARLYERLHEMFLRQGRLDHAVTTAQILSGFRASTARELRLLANAAPKALHDVPGCLSDHAWASHLTHPDLCPSLTALLTTLARAHTRLFARTKGMPSFPGAEDEDPTGIRNAIVDACEILSLPVATPLFGRWGGKEALSRRAQPNGALLVDVEAVRWAQPILPYLLGKKLAEGRPELASRGAFSGDRALRAIVTCGLRIGMGHVESSQETTLHRALTASERAALVTAAREIQSLGSKLDVRKWSRAVDLSSARAGLLLSQDVRVARKAIGSEPQGPHDLAPRERIGELCIFATSELYADLRKAIGLAVPTSRAVPRASLQSFSLLSA